MNLKQAMLHDVDNVFLNEDEFAETYIIDGTPIKGIMSQDLFEKRIKRTSSDYAEGITVHGVMLTCASSEFNSDPIRGEQWNIDGKNFIVDNVEPKDGIHTITLIRNEGR